VPHVYTGRVRVRHHELDPFGRVQPSVYLRYLAQAAIEASSDAGFDARWYAEAGGHWIIRRSLFEIFRPALAGEQLSIRTWVEDFRRVRSHRRYEVRDRAGEVQLWALTDWVFVDAVSGRPRRVPDEMTAGFGLPSDRPAAERPPWSAPAPAATPARSPHRVRFADLDSLGHMNNAAYLDVLVQAVLDVLGDVGWPLDRLASAGALPWVAGGDVEYLGSARYDDHLETTTWFRAAPDGVDVHQSVAREGEGGRPLVRSNTRWRWTRANDGTAEPTPGALLSALRPLIAA